MNALLQEDNYRIPHKDGTGFLTHIDISEEKRQAVIRGDKEATQEIAAEYNMDMDSLLMEARKERERLEEENERVTRARGSSEAEKKTYPILSGVPGEDPEAVKERYQLDTLPANDYELMEIIGRKRGCLRPGGKINLHKVSEIILNELRDGTLGRLTLETPEVVEKEQIILEKEKEAKKAAKEARKNKRKGQY